MLNLGQIGLPKTLEISIPADNEVTGVGLLLSTTWPPKQRVANICEPNSYFIVRSDFSFWDSNPRIPCCISFSRFTFSVCLSVSIFILARTGCEKWIRTSPRTQRTNDGSTRALPLNRSYNLPDIKSCQILSQERTTILSDSIKSELISA